MAELDLPRASDLPTWMKQLRDRYLQTDTGLFVIHGNVHDWVYCAGRPFALPDFLDAFFAPSGKLVIHYDPGRGIVIPNDDHAAKAAVSLVSSGMIPASKLSVKEGTKALAEKLRAELAIERAPEVVLEILEALLLDKARPCALILHYAELIAPDGASSSLSFYDRTAAARLHRWSLSSQVVSGDNAVILVTNALPDLARAVARNPRVGSFSVPLPGPLERARFLAHLKPSLDPDSGETLTRVTAGLQLRQIQDLVAPRLSQTPPSAAPTDPRALFQGTGPLPIAAIAQRKKEILEQECFGLIEVVDGDHGFDAVGGMEPIKQALTRVASHVKAGRRAQVPMGVLFVGPMGTGKSFLAEAFAHESGLAAVKLKNFRDKWVGSTEANLEKVLSVIEGLGEILVMIDEGDRSIGGNDGDSGVSSRVTARLKEFMSDPSHRGRIVFVMMTNRPDKLDVDMKRPGRFDLKIPFFAPLDATERAAIVRAVLRRHRVEAELPDDALLPLLTNLEGYSAADLEALVLLAYDDYQSETGAKPPKLDARYLANAVADFMPTRERAMIEYMELLAVQEASNRRLLPPRFKDITLEALSSRLEQQRRLARL